MIESERSGMATAGSGWPGGRWKPYPAAYGRKVVPNVPLVMSDGVTLIADIEYPADLVTGERAPGKFPVLMTQNPYSGNDPVGTIPIDPSAGAHTGAMNPAHDYFVTHGYIFLTVCVRGTGRSEGDFGFFGTGRVAQDGVEMAHWAAEHLDGSNGEVGMTGMSFLGMTQLFTAALLPKGSPVKFLAPFGSGAETYREDIMGQGMPTQTINLRAQGFHFIIGPKGGAWGTALYNDVIAGGPKAYFGDFWRAQTPGLVADKIAASEIPILLWTGWADIFNQSAHELYAYLQNAHHGRPVFDPMKPGDAVTNRYQLVVGPWDHGGGVDQDLQLEWFDTWLKPEPTGMADTPSPIHLYDLTTSEWVNAARFPMTLDHSAFHLGPGGALRSSPAAEAGSVKLRWGQPDEEGTTATFTSEPLASGATLAGPVGVRLHAASTGTNCELIGTLFDLAPDGSQSKITAGYVIGSLAEQDPERAWYDTRGLPIRPYGRFDRDRYMEPGSVYQLDFWLNTRLATIRPGHALRLVISTQATPEDCTGVAGVNPCVPTEPQVRTLPGTYSVEFSSAHPSLINVPLLPLGAFPPAGNGPVPLDWG